MSASERTHPDLRELPFFARLPDSAIRKLAGGIQRQRYKRGEVLCGERQPAQALTMVCKGGLKSDPPAGASGLTGQILGPGDWFGADAVLLGPRERRTIVAAEDVEVGWISRAGVDDLLRHSLQEALGAPPGDVGPAVCDADLDDSSEPPRRLSRIGLALSGGGAKAFAHLGVLKVLCEAGIRIDVVAGTSAGAIAAAMFCAGKSVAEMYRLAEELRRRVLRREGMWDFLEPPTVGLIRGERTQALYDQILDGATFEQLRTPLAVPATDIVTGEKVVFETGPLSQAIRASAGIPGLFAPWPYAGRYLAEGGLVDSLPVDLARRRGADLVIACDVTGCPDEIRGETLELQAPNLLGLIAARASAILHLHTSAEKGAAEILIRPDVQDYEVLDYPMADDLIELGEAAARAMLPEIRKAVGIGPKVGRSPAKTSSIASAGCANG